MAEIAAHFKISARTVKRAVQHAEKSDTDQG
jgi:hypothetical protein